MKQVVIWLENEPREPLLLQVDDVFFVNATCTDISLPIRDGNVFLVNMDQCLAVSVANK